jgi:hypothetical protein
LRGEIPCDVHKSAGWQQVSLRFDYFVTELPECGIKVAAP